MTGLRSVLVALAAAAFLVAAPDAPPRAQQVYDAGENWRESAGFDRLLEALRDEARRLAEELNRTHGTDLVITVGPEDISEADFQTGWTERDQRRKFRYMYITPLERLLDERGPALASRISEVRIASTHGSMFPIYEFSGGVLTVDVIMSRGRGPSQGPDESYISRALPKLRAALGI
jgi:hypothetical protein